MQKKTAFSEKVVRWASGEMSRRVYAVTGLVFSSILIMLWVNLKSSASAMGRNQVRAWIAPELDSIRTKQRMDDSLFHGMRDTLQTVQALQEVNMLAERKANPKFDSALQQMARATAEAESDRAKNRELIGKLTAPH